MENNRDVYNRLLYVCGIICIVCGLSISVLAFKDGDSDYYKYIGPIQIVAGVLFVINAKRKTAR